MLLSYGDRFHDDDFICCSAYGVPRSKDYHWPHYKELLRKTGLPDIRWHDLRATYCTLLLKGNFNPKAVSKLMGHAKEIITVDVYGDNKNLIAEEIPELVEYMQEGVKDVMGTEVAEYDENLVRKLIEKITVYDDHFVVEFKSGLETEVAM